MQADTVKLVFTYLIALVVIIGGGVMLYLTKDDPTSSLALVIAGFIGSALTFVFGSESATRATRAAQSSTAAGATAALATPAVVSDPPKGEQS